MAKKKNAGTKYFGEPLTYDPAEGPTNCGQIR